MSALTEQYKIIKMKYPDAILLFRVGDFYEAFGEDAKVVSDHLGIVRTEATTDDVKEMAGFPFHALDAHLRTLVKAGYRVAICEELEDPRKRKGEPKRGVSDYMKP
jgi:DNA mismatch repair protein MutS